MQNNLRKNILYITLIVFFCNKSLGKQKWGRHQFSCNHISLNIHTRQANVDMMSWSIEDGAKNSPITLILVHHLYIFHIRQRDYIMIVFFVSEKAEKFISVSVIYASNLWEKFYHLQKRTSFGRIFDINEEKEPICTCKIDACYSQCSH